ncbi:hypothetical protein DM872_14010 [Pseudomonas taiwanensis]|uniref:hypothetical protein n=1 Tax=Pseudomonas TaxID=286 RepID=UPI0015BADB0D|nr:MULTISPECIES: hypothetical protein [Pseudomonas]MDH4559701.1 hypothetical protein [Pseudomonas sp. BN411]MDH4652971.1 hypothetical protein [Pseudomonas sp. BN606]MDH4872558.1 hypothetical protein [Pseudomonas sp. BN515]NWL77968.1 hypothetical protein [Pseudomonas taiwanensis]
MSTLPKRELIDQSIGNIFKLLSDIAYSPGSYVENKQVFNALKSQGNLCALDLDFTVQDEQLAIRPISLNTLKKRLSDNSSDINFQHLDKLRVQAQAAIRKFSEDLTTPKKKTRSALEDQIEELKKSVATLHAVNMVLIQALEVNRRDLITISDTPSTGLRQKRINDAINRIIKILNLNPAPFDDITILSMKKHLQSVPNEK